MGGVWDERGGEREDDCCETGERESGDGQSGRSLRVKSTAVKAELWKRGTF